MRARTWLVWLILLIGLTQAASASSLWDSSGSMFSDQKARQVGDLVTVIIVERTEASQEARTTTGKDAGVSISPGGGLLSDVLPQLRASGGDEMSAGGATTRGGSLRAQMTTRVVEKMGNGNLRIEGRQTIVLNGEEQSIVVTGTIRQQDISPDNTILSTYVADANIEYKGSGSLGDKQEPGLLTRIFRWLF